MGEVSIFSANKDGVEKAVAWIKGIVAVPEVGRCIRGQSAVDNALWRICRIYAGQTGLASYFGSKLETTGNPLKAY